MLKKIQKSLVRISDIINNFAKVLAIIMVILLTIVVLLQVIFRYILNIGLPWVDEISRYLNVWVAFLGASIGFKYGDHVGVAFLTKKLPEQAEKIYKIITNIFMFVFLCLAIYYSYNYVASSRSVTPMMRLPFQFPKAALLVGLSFMGIHHLSIIFSDIVSFFYPNTNTDILNNDYKEGVR